MLHADRYLQFGSPFGGEFAVKYNDFAFPVSGIGIRVPVRVEKLVHKSFPRINVYRADDVATLILIRVAAVDDHMLQNRVRELAANQTGHCVG